MKIFKKTIIIILLLLIYVSICAISYVNAVSSNIQKNVFRLHVVANSNSEEDQNLKYIVRDKILEYINTNFSEKSSKEEIINFVNNNLNIIQQIATDTIVENGYNYTVKTTVGNFSFPTKTYGDISLPVGFYDALKIEIGKASGQNWWCVMFPPLCFIDVSSGIIPTESKEFLKESLSSEEYNLLHENSNDFKIKFKIVEMFQNLNIKTAKK